MLVQTPYLGLTEGDATERVLKFLANQEWKVYR
jgi:hypothetical protein